MVGVVIITVLGRKVLRWGIICYLKGGGVKEKKFLSLYKPIIIITLLLLLFEGLNGNEEEGELNTSIHYLHSIPDPNQIREEEGRREKGMYRIKEGGRRRKGRRKRK